MCWPAVKNNNRVHGGDGTIASTRVQVLRWIVAHSGNASDATAWGDLDSEVDVSWLMRTTSAFEMTLNNLYAKKT